MTRCLERALETFLLSDVERTVNVVEQERAVTDYCVDRRAQLVAHRSIEAVARAHCLLESNLTAVQLIVHL